MTREERGWGFSGRVAVPGKLVVDSQDSLRALRACVCGAGYLVRSTRPFFSSFFSSGDNEPVHRLEQEDPRDNYGTCKNRDVGPLSESDVLVLAIPRPGGRCRELTYPSSLRARLLTSFSAHKRPWRLIRTSAPLVRDRLTHHTTCAGGQLALHARDESVGLRKKLTRSRSGLPTLDPVHFDDERVELHSNPSLAYLSSFALLLSP